MPQPTAMKQPGTPPIVNTNRTAEVFDRSPSSAGWNTNNPKPARRSILERHTLPETLEPFVEANAAAEFLHYSARSIKQMARERTNSRSPVRHWFPQEVVFPDFGACGASSLSGKFRSWRSWS